MKLENYRREGDTYGIFYCKCFRASELAAAAGDRSFWTDSVNCSDSMGAAFDSKVSERGKRRIE